MNNERQEGATSNPVKIQDTTFRDGHQSLLATRLRTEDIIPIAEKMDEVGFWAMEVWGGATFDAMHRFLGEDPFERLKTLKKHIKKTPFTMLLRGQNLLGYRHYADDVVRLFVDRTCDAGMDIFRIFDALNDFRNIHTAVERVKANGKHFEGAVLLTLSEKRLGGEVFTLDYYVKKGKELEAMGADTVCFKDMGGIMNPFDIGMLIEAVKAELHVPIHFHAHYTSGMASMAYLEAIRAGVDIIDTCLAPFALRTSQPSVEAMVAALHGTERDPKLDLHLLVELGDYLESIAPKYRDYLDTHRMSVIDPGVLAHQIPGGMVSNLVSQLKEAKALDRLAEVYKEVSITRRELGMPPLATPTSQIVGVQAVLNVLFGRYKMVTNEVRDLAYGLYGRTPVPIDPEIQKKVLKGYKKGEKPITGRPADYLAPELDEARKKIGDLARNDDDLLIYALYPTTGERFLKWKYGLEEKPPEIRAKTLEDIRKEDEAVAAALKPLRSTKQTAKNS